MSDTGKEDVPAEDGPDAESVPASDDEWRERLSPTEYEVLREAGTEPPHSSDLLDVHEDGQFRCGGCDTVLFESDAKFDSGTGWPSFSDARDGAVERRPDTSHGMDRTEVVCGTCGGHLGHVFDDGPDPTGKRYCINGVALEFDPTEE